ncbi:MAG: ABC transporter permease subunit [Acidimicrobiales bacterium]|nr:ABC transporter permease subunit [Acidimicrobiales bacterium]
MTAVRTGSARRHPILAIAAYTLRTCIPGRRRIGILIPCVVAVLFGLLVRGLDDTASRDFAHNAVESLFGLVMPVTCLVIGDAVLGAEVRRGSFTFTWMSPVPTWQIVVGRFVGGSVVAAASLVLAFGLSALVAGTPESVGPVAVAAVFGAMAYIAIFMAVGCIAQRAAVWSLAFVFLVERLLGSALSGVAQLSPSWEARAAFVGLADAPRVLERGGIPHGGAALVRLVVITLVALLVAQRRLPRMRMAGSAD